MLISSSPAYRPARCAGVSSMGAMILNAPSSSVTSTPIPPKCPVVCSVRLVSARSSRNTECSSSPLMTPRIAVVEQYIFGARRHIVVANFYNDFGERV